MCVANLAGKGVSGHALRSAKGLVLRRFGGGESSSGLRERFFGAGFCFFFFLFLGASTSSGACVRIGCCSLSLSVEAEELRDLRSEHWDIFKYGSKLTYGSNCFSDRKSGES